MQPEQGVYTYEPCCDQHSCRLCGRQNVHTHQFSEIETLLRENRTIATIFLHRQITEGSLRESHRYISSLLESQNYRTNIHES